MIHERTERTESARPQPSEADAKFSGVAAHPLGRRWLRRRLKQEARRAMQATGEERREHRAKADEIRAMLRPEGGEHGE